jgi:uncharacterized protein (TIGR03067 family)
MFAATCFGLAVALGAPGLKPAEAQSVVGEWTVDSRVRGGKPVPGTTNYTTVELTADGQLHYRQGTEIVGTNTYKVDPTKTPAEFDLTVAEGRPPVPGIFKVDKGVLVLCSDRSGTRPTKFESPDGSQVELWTFKRVPKKD